MSVSNEVERPNELRDDVPPPWVGQRMTQDEFLALPHVKPYLEFVDGLVLQKMSPKPTHASLEAFLTAAFNQVAGPKQLGLAMPELRFVSPGWAPVPDVAYYRRERIQLQNGRLPTDFFEPPDIAVEIVSPDQSVTRLVGKCLRYLSLGTSVVLLVDPDPEAVLMFRAGRPPLVLQGDDRIDIDDVLPGLELTVRGMFEALVPRWLSDDPEPSVEHASPLNGEDGA